METTIVAPLALKPRVAPTRPVTSPPPLEDSPEAFEAAQPAGAPDRETEDAEDSGEPGTPGAMPVAAGDGARGGPRDDRTDAYALPKPEGEQDGTIVVGEPTAARDGIPDMRRDPRSAEELAAFALPPADLNPYLYTIELNPLTDRRTRELFRNEPYIARGVRIGSFVLFPEAQLGGIATSNVFRATPAIGDRGLEVGANARIVSDWRMHAVEFRASGLASFYDEHPSEDDRAFALEARGRLDLSRRTNMEALVLHQADKDKRGLIDSPGAAAARGNVETDRVALALNHRFNRLALQLRGSITDIDFAPVADIVGGTIPNDERDVEQRDIAFRASWALNGTLDVFGEVGANDRRYHAAPADGILRSSTGERYRTGLTFAPQSSTIRGEVSIGWGRQAAKSGQLSDIGGFLVDANLAWRATALTTFLLTASTDFTDTTTTGSAGAISRQVGIAARHALRRYLIASAGIRYTVNPYDGVPVEERDLTAELGLDYYVGSNIILFARYQHVDFDSSVPGSDYTADIGRIGVRVRQ
ncbi:MAG: outer membrane beta-barrel protein [Hyphomicrobiaceae bacterium]